ncbi:MAG TPA: condensation domain-containing protein [Nostocaceae cyanobacterium]|nr:condensation domain-containing protein [Nostocaceae cyanobacterium]
MTNSVNGLEKSSEKFATVVELLRYRSLVQAEAEAFTFLEDGEKAVATLTYQELDWQSRAIASQLQALQLTGERALLLYPPGLDYLVAFFGCLYAGVVAVPAYPPRNHRNTPRIQAILKDAAAAIILTTSAVLPQIQSLLTASADIQNLQWLTTDNINFIQANDWQKPVITPDTLAFLQYTSGSTGIPKGVMLTHGNLLHNAAMTYICMEHSPNSKFITWLPVYHDMGLIGGVLQPLYGGFPCKMMSPVAFLQQPFRWLQAISDYRGTTSGAPNFAYDLCVEKITAEQRAQLDLSSWDVAFNGAEPVRQKTLERFSETFAECGFRPQAFYPCYGMAEATLMIAGTTKSALATTIKVEKTGLEQNQVIETIDDNSITLVGCDLPLPEQQIVITHPDNLTLCQEDEVGEIWVSSPSVGHGYWHRQEETQVTFQAYLKDKKAGTFLRTGDLGFLHNGQLFITGRAKDLIIIRGRNLYPQDIEITAENSHPALRLSGCAAFATEVENEEKLVIIQELEFRAKPDFEEVVAAIRQAVSQEFAVQVYAVVLIKPGSLPKTSSGKVQRRTTKAQFLSGTLNVIYSSIFGHVNLGEPQPEDITSYLQKLVAQVLSVPLKQVNIDQPLSSLGIDSLQAFDLKNRLQQDLGVSLPAVDLFTANIVQLVEQIQKADKENISQLQPISRDENLPLGLAQERLWFLEQLESGNPFYNVGIAIKLSGKVDAIILEKSLNEIIKRHESLRTTFVAVDGKPVKVIHESLELKLSHLDLTTQENSDADIQTLILQETQIAFDLSQLPLLRGKLLRLQADEHLLVITLHHIISDGWSIGLLIQELATFYQAFAVNKPALLPELSIQYADYAYWQRKCLQAEVLATQINYWQQQLSNSAPLLQLPTDKPRPAIQTFTGRKEFFTIQGDIKSAVKDLNQREGVTLFMILLAVFKTLLYCYTKQEDILVGSPVVGRNYRGTENLIGFFINTLVLRTDFSGNPSFRELLKRLRNCALDAYAHQDLPFEKLVEELQPERNLSYNPLFQVMFILQNAPIPAIELPDLSMHPQEVDIGTSKFDLKFSIWENAQGFQGSMEYKTDLFNAATIAKMNNHFEIILRHVIEKPDTKLDEISQIIVKAEKEKQLIQEQELEKTSAQKLKLIKRKVIYKA